MSEIATQNEWLYEQYRKKGTTIDHKEVRRMNRAFTILGKITSAAFMALCIFAIWQFTQRGVQIRLLGGLMFFYLIIKEIFALCYWPCKKKLTQDYKVTILITCYNEDPTSVTTILENIMALDYPVHEILFLDDGSPDPLAYKVAKSFADAHKDDTDSPDFHIVRFEENRGKRAVMVDGFKMAEGDYIFLLDSDSEILPNALTELLRPFEDGKTTSCVGHIGILNKNENFLTKLQAITYFCAFQSGRSAQSRTGNVVVCSGAFSIHKKDFILENLNEFSNDTFMGIHFSSGDDRALTTFSKMCGGKTRYQNTAYCETLVPNTWKKFISQRRRWQRSAYAGSLKTVRNIFPKKIFFLFWVFAEAYLWLIAIIIFILLVLARGFYFDLVDVVVYYWIVMYKYNSFYMLYRPFRFLFMPFFTLIYGFSLVYTRIHAAITITDDGWGTRDMIEKRNEGLQLGEEAGAKSP